MSHLYEVLCLIDFNDKNDDIYRENFDKLREEATKIDPDIELPPVIFTFNSTLVPQSKLLNLKINKVNTTSSTMSHQRNSAPDTEHKSSSPTNYNDPKLKINILKSYNDKVHSLSAQNTPIEHKKFRFLDDDDNCDSSDSELLEDPLSRCNNFPELLDPLQDNDVNLEDPLLIDGLVDPLHQNINLKDTFTPTDLKNDSISNSESENIEPIPEPDVTFNIIPVHVNNDYNKIVSNSVNNIPIDLSESLDSNLNDPLGSYKFENAESSRIIYKHNNQNGFSEGNLLSNKYITKTYRSDCNLHKIDEKPLKRVVTPPPLTDSDSEEDEISRLEHLRSPPNEPNSDTEETPTSLFRDPLSSKLSQISKSTFTPSDIEKVTPIILETLKTSTDKREPEIKPIKNEEFTQRLSKIIKNKPEPPPRRYRGHSESFDSNDKKTLEILPPPAASQLSYGINKPLVIHQRKNSTGLIYNNEQTKDILLLIEVFSIIFNKIGYKYNKSINKII